MALLLAAALAPLAACVRTEPRAVRLVLSLHGAAGRPVHGLDVTVAVPAGTAVVHDGPTGRIAPAALSRRAGAPEAALDAKFVPHASAPSIRILLASPTPMRDGEVVAVEAEVPSIDLPSRGRFEIARSAVAGPDGATVPGATAWVSGVEAR